MTAFEIVRAAVLAANIFLTVYLFFFALTYSGLVFRADKWSIGSAWIGLFAVYGVLTSATVVMWS